MQNVGIFAGRQNIHTSFIYMAHANQYVVVCYAFPHSNTYVRMETPNEM